MKRNKAIQQQEREKRGVSAEFQFFVETPLTQYKGKYIALLGKKVVASGFSAKEVWERARREHQGKFPTIAKIPSYFLSILWLPSFSLEQKYGR